MFRLPQRSHHQALHQNCKKKIIYMKVCGRNVDLKKVVIYMMMTKLKWPKYVAVIYR